jgi:hypothetical protein
MASAGIPIGATPFCVKARDGYKSREIKPESASDEFPDLA